MRHVVVLAGLVLLAQLLRARGRAFHWWVLPGALALLWWLWVGGGRGPLFLGVFGAFLALAVVEAWQLRNPVPRASLPPLSRLTPVAVTAGASSSAGAPPARRDQVAAALGPSREAMAVAGVALAPPAAPSQAPPRAEVAVAPTPPPKPPATAPKGLAAPVGGVLARLLPHASSRQRAELWPKLAAAGEVVAAPEGASAVAAVLAHGPWGREIQSGLRLDWEPLDVEPAGATVLALRCSGPDLLGGTAQALVPTSLVGVKPLDREGRRWAGRGVFVPWHLVLGEEGAAAEPRRDILPGQFNPESGR